MSEEFTEAELLGMEPAEAPRSATERAAEAVKTASRSVNDAIETGRRPGMPLDVLSRLVREAPLQSLAVAFLCGVILARRR
jgi:hypothetical protein